jgi:hypothetical protein
MADTKITALTALTGANSAPGDLLTLVDVSDTTMDAAGTNKSITRQELQTYNAGTLTTDVKVLDLSATWNDAGVTFTGLKFNVTDTASAAGSLLLDLQVGGTSNFYFDKAGKFVAPISSGYIAHRVTSSRGSLLGLTSIGGVACGSDGVIGFTSGAPTAAADVIFARDAAATLAQRNSTNAQTFRLYRTYTDSSNYQRLTNTWSTSTAVIHNEGAGTSADGSIAFNDAALATDTTKGFIMIPSCAGAPTGTPADIPTGQIPIVFDSTNNKLYVYDGGWISTAALT